MSLNKLRKNAKRLNSYMAFRAKKEFPNGDCNGDSYGLDTNFFYDCFKKGMRTFFGIECSSDGAIIRDNQNPEAYKEYVGHKKSSGLDKEYIEVLGDKTCRIPLIQATELLKLKPGTLPTVKMMAKDLMKIVEFFENEKTTALEVYQNQIFLIRERLIPQEYLKVKDKLKPQFKPSSFISKDPDVNSFTYNCIILELDHMPVRIKGMPIFLGEEKKREELILH